MMAVEAVKEKFYCFLGIVHPTYYQSRGWGPWLVQTQLLNTATMIGLNSLAWLTSDTPLCFIGFQVMERKLNGTVTILIWRLMMVSNNIAVMGFLVMLCDCKGQWKLPNSISIFVGGANSSAPLTRVRGFPGSWISEGLQCGSGWLWISLEFNGFTTSPNQSHTKNWKIWDDFIRSRHCMLQTARQTLVRFTNPLASGHSWQLGNLTRQTQPSFAGDTCTFSVVG